MSIPATPIVRTGLDRWAAGESPLADGERVSVLCHAASLTTDLIHVLDVLRRADVPVVSILGPEHGVDGAAQDMESVEVPGRDVTPAKEHAPVYSLYGDTFDSLIPTPAMFHGATTLVCDLVDVGSRYYTYAWTVLLAAEVALEAGLRVVVLDRPNPLGGGDDAVEGGSIDEGYDSFVGLHPVPTRHGMTLGELVSMAVHERGVDGSRLAVWPCSGWRREAMFPAWEVPWVAPSPNMPSAETAFVYPGQCLLEGTNLSEGRGTTRPFELFGAPWLDGRGLLERLTREDHPGLAVRPATFKPMFQKHAGVRCEGLHLHVVEPRAVRSLRTTWALLSAMWQQSRGAMKWRTEPYEFVSDRLAIDLLAGGTWLRAAVESGAAASDLVRQCEGPRQDFLTRRRPFLRYA